MQLQPGNGLTTDTLALCNPFAQFGLPLITESVWLDRDANGNWFASPPFSAGGDLTITFMPDTVDTNSGAIAYSVIIDGTMVDASNPDITATFGSIAAGGVKLLGRVSASGLAASGIVSAPRFKIASKRQSISCYNGSSIGWTLVPI